MQTETAKDEENAEVLNAFNCLSLIARLVIRGVLEVKEGYGEEYEVPIIQ